MCKGVCVVPPVVEWGTVVYMRDWVMRPLEESQEGAAGERADVMESVLPGRGLPRRMTRQEAMEILEH